MDLHEDLKRWGMWNRQDSAPTRPPRCPLGRIALISDARNEDRNDSKRPDEVRYEEIEAIDLAVKKVGQIDRLLKLILAAYYQYQLNLKDVRLQSPDYFNCSQRTIYRKFNRAKSLVAYYVNY